MWTFTLRNVKESPHTKAVKDCSDTCWSDIHYKMNCTGIFSIYDPRKFIHRIRISHVGKLISHVSHQTSVAEL
jgi:hypothetical protein